MFDVIPHPASIGVPPRGLLARHQGWHPVLPVLAGGRGPVVVVLVGYQKAVVIIHLPAEVLLLSLAGISLRVVSAHYLFFYKTQAKIKN